MKTENVNASGIFDSGIRRILNTIRANNRDLLLDLPRFATNCLIFVQLSSNLFSSHFSSDLCPMWNHNLRNRLARQQHRPKCWRCAVRVDEDQQAKLLWWNVQFAHRHLMYFEYKVILKCSVLQKSCIAHAKLVPHFLSPSLTLTLTLSPYHRCYCWLGACIERKKANNNTMCNVIGHSSAKHSLQG